MKKKLFSLLRSLTVLIALSSCIPAQPVSSSQATLPEPQATQKVLKTAIPSIIPSPTPNEDVDELTREQMAILSSLKKISDYPLYTMTYSGEYTEFQSSQVEITPYDNGTSNWACSLFTALADPQSLLFGRNFDWQYSPALLLFSRPPDGYASASMVDIGYLVNASLVNRLDELPLHERRPLLQAPNWPFDGMNEHGLVIGMAAVPPGNVPPDSTKETIDSLMVMRKVLDHAKNLDEALGIINSYNIDFNGGPPLHYLLADSNGDAALVEYSQGEIIVLHNQEPWHAATNFLRSQTGNSAEGYCWRYDRIVRQMTESGGVITPTEAIKLLADVAQANTQWSVVYSLNSRDISVVTGRNYKQMFSFSLR